MATIRFEFEGDPSDLVAALSDINTEVAKTDAAVKKLGDTTDKKISKDGPSAFAKMEAATGKLDQGVNGLKKSMELVAGAVVAVTGAIVALTKGAMDEATRQTKGLTKATDKQVAASKQLVAQQKSTIASLTDLRTDVLSPLIPVIADTAAGVEALGKSFEDAGDGVALGETLARQYKETLIPALTTFGMTADFVFTAVKADLNMIIGLTKTLFYSLTFQWKKATDAAADVQEGWSALGEVADRWGEWQDVILETNSALTESAEAADKLPKAFRDNTAKVESLLRQLWGVTEDFAFSMMNTDQQIIESGENRKNELVRQSKEMVSDRATTAEQVEEIAMALGDALDTINEETRAKLKASQELRDEEELEAAQERVEELLEYEQQLADDKLRIAEETVEKQKQLEQSLMDFSGDVAGTISDLASFVAGEKIKAAEDGSAAEKAAALESFEVAKAASMVSALVSTALAVVNALATPGVPYPVAVAFSIAAGVQGALSVAAIAAQEAPSLHRGTLTSDESNAIVRANEAVLTPAAVDDLGGMGAVADMNRGRNATSGGAQTLVTVFRVNNKAVDSMMTENLRTRRGPLSESLRSVQPTRVQYLGHARPRKYAA